MRLSQDGFKILSIMEDRSLKLSRLSFEKYNRYSYYTMGDTQDETMGDGLPFIKPSVEAKLGESIYDAQWLPLNQNPSNEDLVLVSMRDHPIHLYDLQSRSVRCAYVGRNHLDELESALCIAFNHTGDKFYTGADRTIRCFDLNTPGSECTSFYTSKSRKSMFGQKGLISCLQFNPDGSGCYAAGSFLGNVSIYVEQSPTSVLDITQLGHGVTHLRWSPCGHYLWVGTRQHPELSCWDIRATKNKLHTVTRTCNTNQRMIFDLDPWGQHLVTGDQSGNILCYDITAPSCPLIQTFATKQGRNLNTCLFHPFYSLLLTASGERVFDKFDDNLSSSESETEEPAVSNTNTTKKRKTIDDTEQQQQQKEQVEAEKGSHLTVWAMDWEKLKYDVDATATTNENNDMSVGDTRVDEESSEITIS